MGQEPYLPKERRPELAPQDRRSPRSPGGEPSWQDYVASARPHLRSAAAVIVLGTLLAAGIAFVWPAKYRAVATLLPPNEEDTGFSVTTVLRNLSMPGIKIPSRTGPEDVTLGILESRRVAGILVDRYDMKSAYRLTSREAAVDKLRKRTKITVDPSGTVIVAVEDRQPKRAADLANGYVEELDRFNREARMTRGRRMRLFVEKRLEDTKDDLAKAEDQLRDYEGKHKAVALSASEMTTVETGARLFAEQSALQVQIGVTRGYASESSEEVRRLRDQLGQINQELAKLPSVGLELGRLVREVKIQEQVYSLLSGQYEEARIEEARDVPTVDILDVAHPPESRSWPRRGLLIGLGFALSTLGALAWIAWSVRNDFARA